MNNSRLKKRLFYKKATALPDRAAVKKYSRRDETSIKLEEEHPNDEFESFFDFEEDLSDLPSSSDQFKVQEEINSINPMVLEEVAEFFTVLEEIPEKEEEEDKTGNSLGIVLADINFCEFNDSGKSCDQEKSKNSIYCENHKNQLIKKIQKETHGLKK